MCAAERGSNVFSDESVARVVLRATKHYHEMNRWYAHVFLVMPDHVHGLFSFPVDVEMRKVVSAWKSFTAKETGVCWQRDFFEHRLRNEENFDAKADYIRENPVRANLCAHASEWPHVWPR
jgi:putative transposase